jgi:hypothetical protein
MERRKKRRSGFGERVGSGEGAGVDSGRCCAAVGEVLLQQPMEGEEESMSCSTERTEKFLRVDGKEGSIQAVGELRETVGRTWEASTSRSTPPPAPTSSLTPAGACSVLAVVVLCLLPLNSCSSPRSIRSSSCLCSRWNGGAKAVGTADGRKVEVEVVWDEREG